MSRLLNSSRPPLTRCLQSPHETNPPAMGQWAMGTNCLAGRGTPGRGPLGGGGTCPTSFMERCFGEEESALKVSMRLAVGGFLNISEHGTITARG